MEKRKRIITFLFAVLMAFSVISVIEPTAMAKAEVNVTGYTYKITPLLPPFNEYFFVETDNPDPESFRFADKSSKYSEESTVRFVFDDFYETPIIYTDIKYDDPETGRVNGGYLFKSYDTDGGEIVLQSKNDAYYSWDVTWSDTNVKLKLPALTDDIDYLISTYATKGTFFDNMDAVESGFSSICLYSGSYIRGELERTSSYWSIGTSPHIDQVFYLYSPYTRKDNKKLFASVIYPFRYDSLGFPSVMATVSKRLSSASTYEWDDSSHAYINVTYKGVTRSYGGQGNGEGQGISEDKIKQYFTFGANGTKLTLKGCKELLDYYSQIKMADDVPRKGALTWKQVCDTVGDGSWVRLSGCYTYLYKKNSGDYHWNEDAFGDGSEIYWGGDLGYFSDAWVDGRYISSWENYVPGKKFEDRPTSDIFLKGVDIPQISYKYGYNEATGYYESMVDSIKIEKKDVLFVYNEENKNWQASYSTFNDGCFSADSIAVKVEKGVLERKYLDMITLTLDEVKALKVDRNTDKAPVSYYLFDGSDKPGTDIKDHTHKYTIESEITSATLTKNGTLVEKCLCGAMRTITLYSPKAFTLSKTAYIYNGKVQTPSVTVKDSKGKVLKENTDYTVTHSYGRTLPGKYSVRITFKGKYSGSKILEYEIKPQAPGKVTAAQTSGAIKLTWSKVTGADGYRVYMYDTAAKKWVNQKTLTANTYTVSKLKANTTYQFKIIAYEKGFDSSVVWGTYTPIIKAATKLAAPATIKTAVNSGAVKLSWSKAAGADGYRVYMYDASSDKWVKKKTLTGNSYTVGKLKANTTYRFKIVAYKNSGNTAVWGDYSSVIKATTKLSAPSGINVARNESTIKLTWNKVAGATGYRVYMYNASTKKWVNQKTLTGTSLTVSKLKAATIYQFKLIAYKKTGDTVVWGDYTDALRLSTRPVTPEITAVASTAKGRAAVTWTNVAGETGYELWASTKKDSGYKKIVTTKADVTKGVRTDLVSGRTYYLKVRAYKETPSGTAYSYWSTAKTIKIK